MLFLLITVRNVFYKLWGSSQNAFENRFMIV